MRPWRPNNGSSTSKNASNCTNFILKLDFGRYLGITKGKSFKFIFFMIFGPKSFKIYKKLDKIEQNCDYLKIHENLCFWTKTSPNDLKIVKQLLCNILQTCTDAFLDIFIFADFMAKSYSDGFKIPINNTRQNNIWP